MYHPLDYIDNTAEERRLGAVLHRLLTEWDGTELNAVVYQAYGLSGDETAVIEESLGNSA